MGDLLLWRPTGASTSVANGIGVVAMRRSGVLAALGACCALVLVAGLAVSAAAAPGPGSSTPAPGRAATAGSNRGDVVFVRGGDLYLVSHVTGTVRRLTWGGGRDDPAFSPDGRTLAYDRGGDIWLLTVGGSARQLTSGGGSSEPAWSADSRTIAFTQLVAGGGSEIFQVPAVGGGTVRLTWATSAGCSAAQPSSRPGTGWLAYVRSNPGSGSCTAGIVRRKPGSVGQLTVASPYAHQPVFTTDGKQLAYLAPCNGQCVGTAVWLASPSGAGQHNAGSLTGWTCGEGDICVQQIASSPFGGWTEEGTWADPDTGQAFTFFQPVAAGPDGVLTTTAPSMSVPEIVGSFTVRPH
jgi:hypothetical protein